MLISVILLFQKGEAQESGQITFQATTSLGEVLLWRIDAKTSAVPINLTQQLNYIATHSGGHKGPITVSPDGAWYVFLSERFDNSSQGWHGLTIARADLKSAETIKADGQTIHGEGGQATAGGTSVVYVDGGGPHSRDLFFVNKIQNGWTTPVCITASSPFAFNYRPVLARDSMKVLFDAGDNSFPSTCICEVRLDGTGFRVVLTKDSGPVGMSASPAVHSPAYAPDGSIVFEAEWGNGERVWRIPKTGGIPTAVNNTYSNDNSPAVLPDGRIVSLWLGSATGMGLHEIKIMNANGQNGFMLTSSASPFAEIDDIGIGTGPSNAFTSVPNQGNNPSTFVLKQNYPNPFNPTTSIDYRLSSNGYATLKVVDILGREAALLVDEVKSAGTYSVQFDASKLSSGIYLYTLHADNLSTTKRMMLLK